MHPSRVYYIFMALYIAGISAHSTSYTPFMMSIGLSFEQIEQINVWFVIAMLAAEIPTARLADGRGRSFSMKCGTIFAFACLLMYSITTTYWHAVVAELLIGITIAFFSGATNAWIADALKNRGEFHTLRFVKANSVRWTSSAALVSGVSGAAIAHYFGLRVPFFVDSALLIVLIIFTFRYVGTEGDNEEKLGFWDAMRTILRLVRNDRSLIWITAIGMVGSLVVIFNHLWSPFFLQWMPQVWLGAVLATIHILLYFGGRVMRTLNSDGRREILLASVASLFSGAGLVLIGAAMNLPLAFMALAVHEAGRVVEATVLDPFVQHRIESSVRATFNSARSVMTWTSKATALYIASLILASRPDTAETIRYIWTLTGIALIGFTLILILLRPKQKV